MMAHALLMESDNADEVEDQMERIAELQEEARERDLTQAEQDELSALQEAVTPAGLTQRAEQQQRLNEMEENGEAGEFASAMREQEQCFLMADIVNMSKLNIAAKKEYKDGEMDYMFHVCSPNSLINEYLFFIYIMFLNY